MSVQLKLENEARRVEIQKRQDDFDHRLALHDQKSQSEVIRALKTQEDTIRRLETQATFM